MSANHSEKIYQVALSLLPNVGHITAKNLLNYFGSAENVFQATKSNLLKINGIGVKTAQQIIATKPFKQAQKIIEQAEKYHTKILFYTDKNYPERLRRAKDAPILLFYRGTANLNVRKTLSIVGTRQATSYGKEFTDRFICDLKKDNLLIISGLAYGIDVQAHRSAIKYGIPNIAVMGTGTDRIYPPAHQKVASQIIQNGGLLTENQFNTTPEALRFPERNRIIAGLADVTLIVEAKSKGGALITANIAESYNREVCAVPGNVHSKTSEGCNNLIKRHKAHLITSTKDLEELMNWDTNQVQPNKNILPKLEGKEKLVFEILVQYENIHIDQLSWQTGILSSELAGTLLAMELKGLVKTLPGKHYAKTI